MTDTPSPPPETGNASKQALIVAATSSLGVVLCQALAREGWALVLAGGDEDALSRQAADLTIRHHVPVEWRVTRFNAEQRDDTLSYEQLAASCAAVEAVYILADDAVVESVSEAESLARATKRYFTVPATLMAVFARQMQARGNGNIVIVSSVADERASFHNPHYHSARAALLAYVEQMQQQLTGCRLLCISLGMVNTPAWYGVTLPFNLQRYRAFSLSRERAVKHILRAVRAGRLQRTMPFATRWLQRLSSRMRTTPLPWEAPSEQQADASLPASEQQWLPGFHPDGASMTVSSQALKMADEQPAGEGISEQKTADLRAA